VLEAAIGPLSAPAPGPDGEHDVRPVGRRRGEALIQVCRRATAAAGLVPAATKAAVYVTMTLQDLKNTSGAGRTVGSVDSGALLGPETVRKLACDSGCGIENPARTNDNQPPHNRARAAAGWVVPAVMGPCCIPASGVPTRSPIEPPQACPCPTTYGLLACSAGFPQRVALDMPCSIPAPRRRWTAGVLGAVVLGAVVLDGQPGDRPHPLTAHRLLSRVRRPTRRGSPRTPRGSAPTPRPSSTRW